MLRLNLLFAYINQSTGIGAHMGADSGAYLDNPLLRGLNADRFQPLCQGLGYGALVVNTLLIILFAAHIVKHEGLAQTIAKKVKHK